MPFADPQRRREYYANRRRQEREGIGDTRATPDTVPLALRMRTAEQVLDVLEGEVQAVRLARGLTATDKARTIAYLCSVALRAIAAGDLAARLEAVEHVLKLRKGQQA